MALPAQMPKPVAEPTRSMKQSDASTNPGYDTGKARPGAGAGALSQGYTGMGRVARQAPSQAESSIRKGRDGA